ncbi:TrmH family RNA methyltransferase [Snuella sedimenti]|uniref:TrmH family RNA methyltransferase n=1 Tax=Snuella sedimenti TaxID=2798802 RepID=A0A8J7LSY1_9FLAO|nr:TrmH family RNA methyltransferase [Snuella sedimenti]MBJ6367671.1 TrmH family RNA methyltransferase [Snuella sedimenti]
MQLTHYNTNFSKRTFPVTVVSDQVSNAPNLGSLFRISDAFGVEKLILCGEDISLGRKLSKTSRSTEKFVNYEICKSTLETVIDLKNSNYQILSLEITTNSTPIHDFKLQNKKPIALVVGDENFGISDAILKISDAIIHIDMFGNNSSMNVVQATNIALYEITKQLM